MVAALWQTTESVAWAEVGEADWAVHLATHRIDLLDLHAWKGLDHMRLQPNLRLQR